MAAQCPMEPVRTEELSVVELQTLEWVCMEEGNSGLALWGNLADLRSNLVDLKATHSVCYLNIYHFQCALAIICHRHRIWQSNSWYFCFKIGKSHVTVLVLRLTGVHAVNITEVCSLM